jgi:N-formylmaleamate deformylase
MTAWHIGEVVTNGIRTHYARSGTADEPVLVLLHGATDNGMCWAPIAKRLADTYHVVLPDARGHGLSEAPHDGYTNPQRAADVAALITELQLDRPAVGGHSMGGMTTFFLAVEHPELVRCAVLEDPPFRARDVDGAAHADRFRHEFNLMMRASRDELIGAGKLFHPAWSQDELELWADAKLQVSQTFMDNIRRVEEPWQELMPRLARPTLLITADPERGAIVTPEVADEAREMNPEFLEVVRIRGAGHNIRREKSEAFLEAVTGFVAREFART